jgi:tripartite-type tricarboxylate transporter receptor subunit TctC
MAPSGHKSRALTTPPPHGQCDTLQRAGMVAMLERCHAFGPSSNCRPSIAGRGLRLGAAVLLASLSSFSTAPAAEWPERPVRIIVPFAAGGAADVIARLFGDSLSAMFSQQFIVENRAGAGGILGAQTVARADPCGYTLMAAGISSHVLAPAASKNPGYDPIRDFTPIAFFGGAPSVILVHPSLGLSSFRELVALVRRSTGIEYVSSGTGTVGNILVEYIASKQKIKLVHVPYRSGNAAVIDLLAGRVKIGSLNWSTARVHVAAKSLVPIAVSSSKRLAELPDLPTLNELGYPDMITTTWHMLAGPAGVPREIVGALNREVIKIVERPDIRRHFETDAVETKAMTPAELKEFVRAEVAKWTPVVQSLAKPDAK